MTEAEAEKHWCPFAAWRSISLGIATLVQSGDSKNMVLCVGSQCMAWRWDDDFNVLVMKWPDKPLDEIKALADGHCGLAG